MAIPNLPWNVGIAHTEFATSGKVSNAAAAANMPSTFKFSDFVGKSNWLKPNTLKFTLTDRGINIGSWDDKYDNPGYLNGVYYDVATIISRVWKTTYDTYTSSSDIGLRGKNVTDTDISRHGLTPAQYLKLGVAGKPYAGTAAFIAYMDTCHAGISYYIGNKDNLFAVSGPHIGVGVETRAGHHSFTFTAPLPIPGDNEIISLRLGGVDRGIDNFLGFLVFENWGLIYVKEVGGLTVDGSQNVGYSGPAFKVSSYPVIVLTTPILINGNLIHSIGTIDIRTSVYDSSAKFGWILKDASGNPVNVGTTATFYNGRLQPVTLTRTTIGTGSNSKTYYAPSFTLQNQTGNRAADIKQVFISQNAYTLLNNLV